MPKIFSKLYRLLFSFINKQLSIIRKILEQVKIPFFENKSLFEIISFFYLNVSKGAITIRAASISYNLFLSLIPALIFLFTLIAYIPVPNLANYVVDLLKNIMPDYAFKTIQSTVAEILTKKYSTLLSIGFLTTIYFASNSMTSLISAFNAISHLHDTRPWWQQRIVGILLLFVFFILFLIGFLVLVLSNIVLNFLQTKGILIKQLYVFLLIVAKWLIVTLCFFLAIYILYYFSPKRKLKSRYIAAGAIMATLFCIAISLGFSYYVSNFGKYNVIYGSLGALIVLLLWIYFNALSLIVGYEFSWSLSLAGKAKTKETT
ncbi:MAG: YihY/virulence factor BrkB family protein [Bacteroidales bacterium]|nr:YihY/virulence factor BrkB family protein [Bacteroidales bacterium]